MLQIVNVGMILQVKRFTYFFEYKFDDFANQQNNAKNNKPRNSLQHAEFPYSSSDRTVCTIAALTASSARYFSFPRWEYRRSTIMARPMPYMRQQGKETIQQKFFFLPLTPSPPIFQISALKSLIQTLLCVRYMSDLWLTS